MHPWRSPTPADQPVDGGPQSVRQRSAAGEDNRPDAPVAVAVGPGAGISQRTPGLMDGGEPGGRVWCWIDVGMQVPGGRPVGAAEFGGWCARPDAEDFVGGECARRGWPAGKLMVT
jgi:hypothetical protein